MKLLETLKEIAQKAGRNHESTTKTRNQLYRELSLGKPGHRSIVGTALLIDQAREKAIKTGDHKEIFVLLKKLRKHCQSRELLELQHLEQFFHEMPWFRVAVTWFNKTEMGDPEIEQKLLTSFVLQYMTDVGQTREKLEGKLSPMRDRPISKSTMIALSTAISLSFLPANITSQIIGNTELKVKNKQQINEGHQNNRNLKQDQNTSVDSNGNDKGFFDGLGNRSGDMFGSIFGTSFHFLSNPLDFDSEEVIKTKKKERNIDKSMLLDNSGYVSFGQTYSDPVNNSSSSQGPLHPNGHEGMHERDFNYLTDCKANRKSNYLAFYNYHLNKTGGKLILPNNKELDLTKEHSRIISLIDSFDVKKMDQIVYDFINREVGNHEKLPVEKRLKYGKFAQAIFDDIHTLPLEENVLGLYEYHSSQDANIILDLYKITTQEELLEVVTHEFFHGAIGTYGVRQRDEGLTDWLTNSYIWKNTGVDNFSSNDLYSSYVVNAFLINFYAEGASRNHFRPALHYDREYQISAIEEPKDRPEKEKLLRNILHYYPTIKLPPEAILFLLDITSENIKGITDSINNMNKNNTIDETDSSDLKKHKLRLQNNQRSNGSHWLVATPNMIKYIQKITSDYPNSQLGKISHDSSLSTDQQITHFRSRLQQYLIDHPDALDMTGSGSGGSNSMFHPPLKQPGGRTNKLSIQLEKIGFDKKTIVGASLSNYELLHHDILSAAETTKYMLTGVLDIRAGIGESKLTNFGQYVETNRKNSKDPIIIKVQEKISTGSEEQPLSKFEEFYYFERLNQQWNLMTGENEAQQALSYIKASTSFISGRTGAIGLAFVVLNLLFLSAIHLRKGKQKFHYKDIINKLIKTLFHEENQTIGQNYSTEHTNSSALNTIIQGSIMVGVSWLMWLTYQASHYSGVQTNDMFHSITNLKINEKQFDQLITDNMITLEEIQAIHGKKYYRIGDLPNEQIKILDISKGYDGSNKHETIEFINKVIDQIGEDQGLHHGILTQLLSRIGKGADFGIIAIISALIYFVSALQSSKSRKKEAFKKIQQWMYTIDQNLLDDTTQSGIVNDLIDLMEIVTSARGKTINKEKLQSVVTANFETTDKNFFHESNTEQGKQQRLIDGINSGAITLVDMERIQKFFTKENTHQTIYFSNVSLLQNIIKQKNTLFLGAFDLEIGDHRFTKLQLKNKPEVLNQLYEYRESKDSPGVQIKYFITKAQEYLTNNPDDKVRIDIRIFGLKAQEIEVTLDKSPQDIMKEIVRISGIHVTRASNFINKLDMPPAGSIGSKLYHQELDKLKQNTDVKFMSMSSVRTNEKNKSNLYTKIKRQTSDYEFKLRYYNNANQEDKEQFLSTLNESKATLEKYIQEYQELGGEID